MPEPQCPNPTCQAHAFEARPYTPQGMRDTLLLIQCTHCGTVVGAVERIEVGNAIARLEAAVRQMGGLLKSQQ